MISTRIAQSVVSVGATATLVVGRGNRRAVALANSGANPIFLGAAGVSAANGFPLAAGAMLRLETAGEIWGIVAAGTEPARVLEELAF